MPEQVLTPYELRDTALFIEWILTRMEYNPLKEKYSTSNVNIYHSFELDIEEYHEFQTIVQKLKG